MQYNKVLLATSFGLLFNMQVAKATTFTLIDSNNLGFQITGFNNEGQLVGNSTTANGSSHAVFYDNGTIKDLGTLPGGTFSVAVGINDHGQIVGWGDTNSGQRHSFLYSSGILTDLGTLGGRDSIPIDINNQGQVVGISTAVNGQNHGFLYSNGSLTDLDTSGSSTPSGINDLGQVVGNFYPANSGISHPFLYDNGTLTDLYSVLGGEGSGAGGINNQGQIIVSVGLDVDPSGVSNSFLYDNGVLTDLGSLPGVANASIAEAINNNGQIVGVDAVPFLYSNGSLTDLTKALINAPSGLTLEYAVAINDNGQILVNGLDSQSQPDAFLLTPISSSVPVPAGIWLFGSALAGFGFLRRR